MKRRNTIVIAVVIALLLACGIAGQVALSRHRPGNAPAVGESVIATLGGFRSLAAEVIWFRADRLQDEGRFGELVQLTSMLTWLEPHDAEVWTYSAWNLAYNVSCRMPRVEDRWSWVHAGIRLLRDEGLKWNPTEANIYRELAFMFELKVGTDKFAPDARLYQEEWRRIVEDVQARGAWDEIGMDPAKMAEVEAAYDISDWTNAEASAIYWAHLGIPHASGHMKLLLQETIRQARILYDDPNRKDAPAE